MFLFSEWRYLNEALIGIVSLVEAQWRVSLSEKRLPESFRKISAEAGEVIVIKRAAVPFDCMYLIIRPGLGTVGAATTTSLSFLSTFVLKN